MARFGVVILEIIEEAITAGIGKGGASSEWCLMWLLNVSADFVKVMCLLFGAIRTSCTPENK